MRHALLLGLVHAAVDAATVTTVFRVTGSTSVSGSVAALVLAYDLLAFGLQPVLGWLQDRWSSPRSGMLAGLGAAVLATTAAAWTPVTAPRASVVGVVALAGLGNAAYHLGAGASVLRQGLARATPIGLLVGPGAAGLALGVWFGRTPAAGPTWLAALPVLIGVVLVARHTRGGDSAPERVPGASSGLGECVSDRPNRDVAVGVVALLMLSVAIRSLVGGASARGYDASLWLSVGLPVVAVTGKTLGGVVADRWGWVRTTVTALVVSCPILAFAQPHPILLLLGLLVFQLTMPVTLVAVARMMPNRLATGFGLTCLALIGGALPGMFSWGGELSARPMLGAWVLLSAVVAWAGLTGAGLSWRRTAPVARHLPMAITSTVGATRVGDDLD